MQACKKGRPEIAEILHKKFKNKVFQKLDKEAFDTVFVKVLEERKTMLRSPKLIKNFYESNGYNPVFVLKHLPKDEIQLLATYYQKANEHGLDPEIFNYTKLKELTNKFYDENAINSADEAYRAIAELEILTANSLINYSSALQYGVINPKWIYARYYTNTPRPDSVSMAKVFYIADMKSFLDSIQPQSNAYKEMQKALISGVTAPGMSREETERILKVNLERLRWKNKPQASKYVWVNIPDYRLQVMENGKSVLGMNVCVGKGRNMDYTDKLADYNESKKVIDTPYKNETPQLLSEIHSVQVNPIWNIPQSIAKGEIIGRVQRDPYYLLNSNIDVYENGEKIESRGINWSQVTKKNLKYTFKQAPGGDNALGKIKFLFKNNSSVYLHDTPAQAAFEKPMRAVSHGCVRVEKPLELAKALFGEGAKYKLIEKEMKEPEPDAKNVFLTKKVPVYLDYVTCWVDSSGKLQFCKDVYQLDIVLFTNMKKYITS